MGIKYKVNEQFFSTWSDNMAYVLGFWYADGSVEYAPAMRGRYIRITSTDKEIVETIKRVMGSEHTIVPLVIDRKRTSYLLRIGNRHLFSQLQEHGVLERKSLTVTFPKVPQAHLGSFIRGYFDGDGCVHLEKNIAGDIQRLVTIFTSGSLLFLEQLRSLLYSVAGTNKDKAITITKGGYGTAYQLRFSTRDSLRIYRLLYPNGRPRDLCLRRKYDIFTRYCKLRGLTFSDIGGILDTKGPVVKR